MGEKLQRVLVTAALPYAEDKPHIGNLFTLVPADVARRFYKILGYEVLFVTGSDEHGTPISLKAELEGISPKELVDKNTKEIIHQMKLLNIEPDSFIRTSSELNKKLTQELFLILLNKGLIEIKETYCYYDPQLKRYLADRYVKGICPYCGAEDQYSDHCDKCGRYLKFGEIKNPYSVLTGSKVEIRKVKHAFFIIRKIKDKVKEYIQNELEMEEGLKKYVLELLEKIDEWDITRNMSWGTPVPLEELKDQVLYVWFDAPVGYLSAVKQLGDDVFKKFWKDKSTKIIHIIGKDIVYHHAIFWISMLLGSEEFNLPKKIYAHGYITLEKKKLSKSRNWVIYAEDFVEKAGINGDYVRYYLATLHTGKIKDGDVSLDDFISKINNQLVADFINLTYRVLKLIDTKLNGKLEKVSLDNNIKNIFIENLEKYIKYMKEFNFCEADKILSKISSSINKYLNDTQPWNLENPNNILYNAACAIIWLCILYYPFIPKIVEKILSLFGLEKEILKINNIGKEIEFKSIRCEKISEKITKDQIEKIKRILEERTKQNKQQNEEKLPIEEFLKFRIVIGEIKEVKELGNKLYKLKVDVGEKEITVVSGIRPYYKKEELIGKKVVVITNLMPKKFLGVISEGMILAAEKDGKVALLTVDKDIGNGAIVK